MLKKETNLESDICDIKEPAYFNLAIFTLWNLNYRGKRSLKFSSVFPISKWLLKYYDSNLGRLK